METRGRMVMLAVCGAMLAGGLWAQSPAWVKAVDGMLARSGAAVVRFNGRIWSLGGRAANAGSPSTANGPLTSEIWSSPDGVTWTLDALSAPWSAREGHAALEFNGRLWVLGTEVWSSADGLTWSRACGIPGWGARKGHSAVVFNNRMWLIGGQEGSVPRNDVWSSADGATWQQEASAAPWPARLGQGCVAFNARMWIMGGTCAGTTRNDVWSSNDGINWTLETAAAAWPARERHATAVHNGRMYLLGGTLMFSSGAVAAADVWSSSDGINWSADTSFASWSARSGAACIVQNNELWLLGGAGSNGVPFMDAWSSASGASWNERAPFTGLAPSRGFRPIASFNGKLWLIGGISQGNIYWNDVWSSPDGVNWKCVTQSAPFSARAGHTLEVFNGRLYLLGGDLQATVFGDVWSTADGITWRQDAADAWPSFTGVSGYAGLTLHYSAVLNGRLWVMGGLNNSLLASGNCWSSPDGVSWAKEGSAFPATYGGVVCTLNGRMWCYGDGTRNVWSSIDGASWTVETSVAPWGTRSEIGGAALDGRLWVMCGYVATTAGGSTPGLQNDVWSSSDGVNWVREIPVASIEPKRDYVHSCVFNGRLLLFGGRGGGGGLRRQDTWVRFPDPAAPQFTNTPPPTAVACSAFAHAPTLAGTTPMKVTVSGNAPAWLEFDGAGAMQGTPTLADIGATYDFSLTAANFAGGAVQNVQLTVLGPAPVLSGTPTITATAGQPYSWSATVGGGPPAPTLSVSGLPPWLSFDAATATFSGTPGQADIGAGPIIVLTASNGTPPDAVLTFSITVVGAAPVFTSTPVLSATATQPYRYAISASGIPAPTITVSGLPPWLSFDTATGEIAGIPPGAAQSGVITVTASNGWGADATQQFNVTASGLFANGVEIPNGCTTSGGPSELLLVTMLGIVGSLAARRRRRQRC